MKNKSITIKTPGKLMIAGEFAVLEPNHHLAAIAVDRFVYARIEKSNENRLFLPDLHLENIAFSIRESALKIHTSDSRVRYVSNAMEIACNYLREQSIDIYPFKLAVNSELDDKSGVKYGLGSSAAVVTSVITAILKLFLAEEPKKIVIFKLAALSHVLTQGNGSGADVAASTFGGIINYSSFQAKWLMDEYKNCKSITDMVDKDWNYLSIESMGIPDNVYFCVGWTGNAASTAKLVDKILLLKQIDPIRFDTFLFNSRKAVNAFLKGVKQTDSTLLFDGIKQNRHALRELGKWAGASIETPLLSDLCDIAAELGGAAKPSGAGGGDCGIAFMPTKESANQLLEAWEKAGIKPLTIKPSFKGATVMDRSI